MLLSGFANSACHRSTGLTVTGFQFNFFDKIDGGSLLGVLGFAKVQYGKGETVTVRVVKFFV